MVKNGVSRISVVLTQCIQVKFYLCFYSYLRFSVLLVGDVCFRFGF